MEWKAYVPNYDLFDGALIGGHIGLNHYKLGQRKGLNIAGKKEPVYVIAKDYKENRLFVGEGKNHPGLFKSVFFFPNSSFGFIEDQTIELEISKKCIVNINGVDLEVYVTIFKDGLFLDFKRDVSILILEKSFLISTVENLPFINIKTN